MATEPDTPDTAAPPTPDPPDAPADAGANPDPEPRTPEPDGAAPGTAAAPAAEPDAQANPQPEPGAPEPEVVFCPVDPSPLPLSFRVEGDVAIYNGDYQGRARIPAADVDVCFGGRIAVTTIKLL